MANVTITEYTKVGEDQAGLIIQGAVEPALAITAYAVTTPELHQFSAETTLFRLYTDAPIEFKVGNSTVNAKTSQGSGCAAGHTEYWPLAEASLYISLYDGSS